MRISPGKCRPLATTTLWVRYFLHVAGRKQRVSNDDYIRVTLEFLQANELEQLTTRALGHALGVDPTAIYRHFPSLDDLMIAVRDHIHLLILQRLDAGEFASMGPKDRLRRLLTATREIYAEHPRMSAVIVRGHGRLPHGLEISRRVLAALGEMGLAGDDLAIAYQMIESTTIGMTIFDHSRSPQHLSMRMERHHLIGGGLAEAATSTEAVRAINEHAFERVIDVVIDACEAMAPR